MLGEEPVHAEHRGRFGHLVKRRVALAEGHDFIVRDDGQQVAKPPDSALVDGQRRCLALLPKVAESAWIGAIWHSRMALHVGRGRGCRAPGVFHLKQIAAYTATKVARSVRRGDTIAASSAS